MFHTGFGFYFVFFFPCLCLWDICCLFTNFSKGFPLENQSDVPRVKYLVYFTEISEVEKLVFLSVWKKIPLKEALKIFLFSRPMSVMSTKAQSTSYCQCNTRVVQQVMSGYFGPRNLLEINCMKLLILT